jgi:murein DD-endopeptidase MepM/ murein hydrolase activator NlpD
MNIILVSGNVGKVRTLTLSGSQLAMIGAGVLLLITVAVAGAQWLWLRHAAQIRSPALQSLLAAASEAQQKQADTHLRESLNAMAVRLGQMQAQLLRLDSLGERLARLSGFKPQEFLFDQMPGRGGSVSSLPAQDLTVPEFTRRLDELSERLDDRIDKLGILESVLMRDRVSKKMLPSVSPIQGGWYSSNFGWRIDPFTGRNAFHEGVDFFAERGTPILAAAGGIVVYSEHHPEYGNMIEIDHGNDLVTRYAHASKRGVAVGEVVLRGQKIGEVGSTGRSTGPHLHFEIRHKGVAQNPGRFLQARN